MISVPSTERWAGVRETLQAAASAHGLFAEQGWRLSPEPFPIRPELYAELEKLGYRLNLFQRACNELYHASVAGRQPPWVAEWLDRGKPPELVELARRRAVRGELPRILRPDLVLTETGFAVVESDPVPGGLGLTGWLSQVYAGLGHDIVGGAAGMIEGFQSILGGPAEILISQEAAGYRPEMEWLAAQCRGPVTVGTAEAPPAEGKGLLYRFFELFDLPQLPGAETLLRAWAERRRAITPPPKPYLEEKMWFALFWLRPLREFWRRELSERHFRALQKVIPFTWLLDPTPLPPHASLPGLEANSWEAVARLPRSERPFILKMSGFSELAWGSRSTVLGSELSDEEWRSKLAEALAGHREHPYVMQRYHEAKTVEQPYFDRVTGAIRQLPGRVRLCPYYFILEGKARLRGALATICPFEHKVLHARPGAILTPAAVVER